MSFTKSTLPTNTISSLADKPTETATQLKAKFDLYSAGDVPYINSLIDELEAVTSAANLGAATITDIDGNTIQSQLQSIRDKLKSITDGSSGADFVKVTAIAGVTGTTLQSICESLKGLIDAIISTTYTKTELDNGQLDTRYYTEAEVYNQFELDNGQLDTRYYTEAEVYNQFELNSQSGTSGTDLIGGKTFDGITAGTLHNQLVQIKDALDAVVLGQIPNSSLEFIKFSSILQGITTQPRKSGGDFLINSDFSVNQLGVSGTVVLAADEYGHDMFKGGAGGCTYTFATSGGVTTITISAGSLIQVVEGLNLDTGTYALSWDGTAQGKIGAGSFDDSGITGAVTGGSNLDIEFDTGTLSKCKLEPGTTPSAFIQRDNEDVLRKCIRHFRRGGYGYLGIFTNATIAQMVGNFGQPMRIAPTITLNKTNPVLIELGIAARTGSGSTLTGAVSDVDGFDVTIDGFSGATVGNVASIRDNPLDFDARL